MFSRLRRLFVPLIFDDEDKTRLARFMVNFSWIAIVTVFLLLISRFVFVADESGIPVFILFGIICVLLLVQYVVRLGYVKEAGVFIVLSLWAALTLLAWVADGIRDLSVIAYIIVIVLASLLLGWRFSFFIGGMSVFVIWYLGMMEKLGMRVAHVDDPTNYARDLTAVIILISVLVYLLGTDWARTLRAARSELKERLRAEERLRQQADYLAALNETALGLLNRSELHPLLESILIRACDMLNTRHGLIEMVLPDESALRQEVGIGLLAQYNGVLTCKNEGVTGSVWASGETLVVQNYPNWNNSLSDFVNAGFYAVLGVPLMVGNVVIGVLAISLVEEERSFTAEQIKFMERFASLAAIAIDNARLYEQTQKELAERKSAEEKFRKIFYASPVAIVMSSLKDGQIFEANEAYWKLSGHTPDETLNKTAVQIGIWNTEEERDQFMEQIKLGRSLYDAEYQFKTKSGDLKSTLAFYELIKLGQEDSVLAMFHDVTEQKNARESLQMSEARLLAILASLPDMIFEISRDGMFLDFMASEDMRPLLPPAEFIGKNVRDLFSPVIADQTFFALERALDTGQLHAFEYELILNGTQSTFEARISSVSSNTALVMVRDITQNKMVQVERENLIDELEDKNSELERFTYMVSHDLKSPLITIKGFLGFVEDDAHKGNMVRLKSDIKRISDAADKMQNLLNDLLNLSRVGRLADPHENIDPFELAHEVVDLLHGRLFENQINVIIHNNLPAIHGDRRRLFEVLQNLVDNAAKFMEDQPAPCIEIGHSGFENQMPIFYVKDNGIGIEPVHQDRVFGLFNKLDAQSEGTGIGLALVKRIIENHKGRIWVESQFGQGATFFFTVAPAVY